jgi:iron complex transport system substrate-binding protein
MTKATKYILLVLFLGLCVFVRWKCAEINLMQHSEIVQEESKVIGELKILNSDSRYFQLQSQSFRTHEMGVYSLQLLNKDRGNEEKLMFLKREGNLIYPTLPKRKNTAVCLSSVYVGYLAALGLEDKIIGVDNLDYISNEEVRNNPNMVEVGNLGQLNIEALLALNPKYVFADDFDVEEGLSQKLQNAGILLVKCNPFREETPLARAEWIKFFGVIFNEYNKACTLFEDTKFNYHLLEKEAEKYKLKPTMFLNAPFGEQWTIPGGNSFQARLMKDAGAKYVFAEDTSSMTIYTGFEEMLTTARSADYWLHLGTVSTKDAFLKNNQNFDKFKAFKEGNLYNNNKNANVAGSIPYWETSGVHPDWVLEDLVRIFHPSSSLDYKFHYYQKLK